VLLEPFTDSPNNHHHRPVASFWGRARCIEQRTTTEGRARWFESTEHNRRAVPDGLNQRHTTVGPCPSAGSAAANEQSESQTFSERFPRTAPRCEASSLARPPVTTDCRLMRVVRYTRPQRRFQSSDLNSNHHTIPNPQLSIGTTLEGRARCTGRTPNGSRAPESYARTHLQDNLTNNAKSASPGNANTPVLGKRDEDQSHNEGRLSDLFAVCGAAPRRPVGPECPRGVPSGLRPALLLLHDAVGVVRPLVRGSATR